MEKTASDGITAGTIGVEEKRIKRITYLPRHLGPMGAWKPIKIANIGAAYRAGKGCVSGKSDYKLKPIEDASAASSDVSGSTWGSD